MDLLANLFSDWVGILSFIVIATILGMAGYFIYLFTRKTPPK